MSSDLNSNNNLSALERAKALLSQSQGNSTASEVTNDSEEGTSENSSSSSNTQVAQPMSALERAKALLSQSKGNSTASEVTNNSEEGTSENSSSSSNTQAAQPMSALERAKALLQAKSSGEPVSATPVSEKTGVDESPTESPATEKPMSALERAKLLLKNANQASAEPKPDPTQALLQQAMRGAEAMIGQLQATADAAKAMVSKEKENISQLADDVGADSPGNLICERGEKVFEEGDLAQAQALFDSALVVDPACIRALNNLGVLALQSDEPWKALSYFLMGIIQNPSDEDILINLRGLFDLNPELNAVKKTVIFD